MSPCSSSRSKNYTAAKPKKNNYEEVMKKHNLGITEERLMDFRKTLKEIIETNANPPS